MKKIFWIICITIIMLNQINSKETFTFMDRFLGDFFSVKLYASDFAKCERARLKGSGKILPNLENSQNILDGWKTSLKGVCAIWNDYLDY